MASKTPDFDYLDEDVAYLVGMIVARGSFHQDGDVRRLVIQFPYRLDAMTPVPGSQANMNRETALRLSLDGIRARITELLEVDLRVQRKAHEVSLSTQFSPKRRSAGEIYATLQQANPITLSSRSRKLFSRLVPAFRKSSCAESPILQPSQAMPIETRPTDNGLSSRSSLATGYCQSSFADFSKNI